MKKDNITEDNKSSKMTEKELKKEILDWVWVIVSAVAISVFINAVLIVNAVIPSGSMENTIMTGDRIFGNRLAYKKEDPKRGDIVIFKFPDDEKQLFIKRVIGEPGDVVEIIDGMVYINGDQEPLDESEYVREIPQGDFGPYEVPEGAFFLMGDNRNHSYDARFWKNTYVYKDKILGKAAFRYYPKIKKIE